MSYSTSNHSGRSHPGSTSASLVPWLFILIAVAGVAGTLYALRRWGLPPLASAEGSDIDRLFTTILVITGIVFFLVQGALGILALRFRDRGQERASYWHENPRLEATWTATTALILTGLTAVGGWLWIRLQSAAPPDALAVEVVAEQFGWRYRYPGPDGRFGRTDARLIEARNPLGVDLSDPAALDDVITQELHVVQDRPVHLLIRSKDVIHSFFVPSMRFKQDAVPGRVIERRLTPTQTGRFPVACTELCGVGHFVMASALVVDPSDQFDTWLQAQPRMSVLLSSSR